MSEQKPNLSNAYTPVLVLLLIVGAFFIGRLSFEVSSLKEGKTNKGGSEGTVVEAQPGERDLSISGLKEKAGSLGLNQSDFDKCLDEGKYGSRVAEEVKEGQNFGVSGTPSFLINGLLVVGAQPLESFERLIDAELKNGGGAVIAKELGEDGVRKTVKYGTGPVMGAENAKIKIVEYTDFECPFCEKAFPTIVALMDKYKGQISLEYKSFPLPFHPNAQKAAEAALCAGDQAKFWEMHDLMFAPAQ